MAKPKLPKSAKRASAPERLDAAIAASVGRWHDTEALKIVRVAGEIADQPPLLAISAAALVLGLALRQPRLARAGGRMLATELLTTGMKALVKRHVQRSRPHKMLKEGRYVLQPDPKGEKNDGPWNSFPSGHTAGAVGVARALAREYPQARAAALSAAGAVAAAQVPTGSHFPSDVLAGAVVGWTAEAIVDAGARRLDAAISR